MRRSARPYGPVSDRERGIVKPCAETSWVLAMLDNEDTVFVVVTNAEQQYSIWPEALPLPAGWSAAAQRGSKAECLAFIDQVWTDMRPQSLREFLRESAS